MILRQARDDDSVGIITLIESCFAEYPGNILDVDFEEPELRQPATAYPGFWVVDDGQGGIVGCIALGLSNSPIAELKKCYVHASQRGQGWGRKLEAEVVAAAQRQGCHSIELWTDTRFTLAHKVYEALGYQMSGQMRELHDLSQTVEYHYLRKLDLRKDPAQG